ncbi:MAG: DUF1844 domain-containing protein [Deltaproteobacteria bacterium]|nr:DUF1844 domain-containing protein [Deltaproteobacteria bacterium]
MSEDNDEKGFVIKDKRIFDETGDVRSEKEEEKPKKETPEKPDISEKEETPHKAEKTGGPKEEAQPFPEINFAGFIFSLHTSALLHFGDFPDPVSNEKSRNLPAAKQTIEILDMMKDKTRGNLDENEEKLLEGILFELKMRYVTESEKT